MYRKIVVAVVVSSFAVVPACAVQDGHPQDDKIVSLDGEPYSLGQVRSRFGQQDLHWVVTQDVLDTGVPTAFTSEAKRDAALGIRVNALVSADVSITVTYAVLYEHDNRGGQSLSVSGSLNSLGSFNNKASSIDTFTNDVVLYRNTGRTGCSLFVQRQKFIEELNDHDFCGLFTGDWNDRAQSIGVTF